MSKCINKECKDWDIDYEDGCSGLGIRHDGHLCLMYIPENESGQLDTVVKCRLVLAKRLPLPDYGVDLILEYLSDRYLCCVGKDKMTDVYPYDKSFYMQEGI